MTDEPLNFLVSVVDRYGRLMEGMVQGCRARCHAFVAGNSANSSSAKPRTMKRAFEKALQGALASYCPMHVSLINVQLSYLPISISRGVPTSADQGTQGYFDS